MNKSVIFIYKLYKKLSNKKDRMETNKSVLFMECLTLAFYALHSICDFLYLLRIQNVWNYGNLSSWRNKVFTIKIISLLSHICVYLLSFSKYKFNVTFYHILAIILDFISSLKGINIDSFIGNSILFNYITDSFVGFCGITSGILYLKTIYEIDDFSFTDFII